MQSHQPLPAQSPLCSIGERIERNLYDLLETLLEAKYRREREALLAAASLAGAFEPQRAVLLLPAGPADRVVVSGGAARLIRRASGRLRLDGWRVFSHAPGDPEN